jgi:uncharacterized membrane protein YozB (DUF420 family)
VTVRDLPTLNALLNATAALLLLAGWWLIRRKKRDAHRRVMLAAVATSVLVTLARALRGRFEAHRAIARYTLPVWIWVSVSGVVVYWMLYRL